MSLGNLRRSLHVLKIFLKMWHYLRLAKAESLTRSQLQGLKGRFMRELLRHFNIYVQITSPRPKDLNGPVIYVCNHISYMDIPLLMRLLPEASFVSKKEVAGWPVIGKAARRIQTIFVDRKCKDSRQGTREVLKHALKTEQKSVIIFPSGTTSMHQTELWKKGIFEIAKDNQVPVIPVRLHYSPLRELAYIDDDQLFSHLVHLSGLKRIDAEIEFGQAFIPADPPEDCKRVQKWSESHLLPSKTIHQPVKYNAALST